LTDDLLFEPSLIGLALIGTASITGHAYSPVLKFQGGRAVAVSPGVWTTITREEAFLVACSLLALGYSIQNNDRWQSLLACSYSVDS